MVTVAEKNPRERNITETRTNDKHVARTKSRDQEMLFSIRKMKTIIFKVFVFS